VQNPVQFASLENSETKLEQFGQPQDIQSAGCKGEFSAREGRELHRILHRLPASGACCGLLPTVIGVIGSN
jgi:hypothetical protein